MMNFKLFVPVCDFRTGELKLVVYEYSVQNSESADDVLPDKLLNSYAGDPW